MLWYYLIENDLGEGIEVIKTTLRLTEEQHDLLEYNGWTAKWIGDPSWADDFFEGLQRAREANGD